MDYLRSASPLAARSRPSRLRRKTDDRPPCSTRGRHPSGLPRPQPSYLVRAGPLTDPPVIVGILAHLGLPRRGRGPVFPPLRAPPRSPARTLPLLQSLIPTPKTRLHPVQSLRWRCRSACVRAGGQTLCRFSRLGPLFGPNPRVLQRFSARWPD